MKWPLAWRSTMERWMNIAQAERKEKADISRRAEDRLNSVVIAEHEMRVLAAERDNLRERNKNLERENVQYAEAENERMRYGLTVRPPAPKKRGKRKAS